MKTRTLTIVYVIIGLTYLIRDQYNMFIPQTLLKALIIPVLIALLLLNLKLRDNRMHMLMLAGLLFSWAGDIILDIPGSNPLFFIAGLASFLVANLMYLTVFAITPGKNFISGKGSPLLVPVIITGIGLISILNNDLGAMRFPVVMYTVVILTMLTGAMNRLLKVNRASYWMVLAGAILFIISDSTIAINKFSHPFPQSGMVVMGTYIAAQYLIITGYIRQFRSPK